MPDLEIWEILLILLLAAAWAVACVFFARCPSIGCRFFKQFGATRARVISVIVMVAVLGAVSMYYLSWFAVPVVLSLCIILFVAVGIFIGKYDVSHVNATLVVSLLVAFMFPVGLTLYRRQGMSSTQKTAVWAFVLGFWVVGFALSRWAAFRDEIIPRGKTRTLLLLLFMSFFCILFAMEDSAVYVIAPVALAIVVAWVYKGADRIVSASLSTYQEGRVEMTLAVGLMIFASILNFSLMYGKDHEEQPETLFVFNTIMFVLALMLIAGVLVSTSISRMEEPGTEWREAHPIPRAALDMFARMSIRPKAPREAKLELRSPTPPSLSPTPTPPTTSSYAPVITQGGRSVSDSSLSSALKRTRSDL